MYIYIYENNIASYLPTIHTRYIFTLCFLPFQITDVELECDGFFNYDRTPKFDAQTTREIAIANHALIAAVESEYSSSSSVNKIHNEKLYPSVNTMHKEKLYPSAYRNG